MSCVYVVCEVDEGPCKIGVTDSLDNRIPALRYGNPRPLKLAYSREYNGARIAESWVHKRLIDKHIHFEWFSVSVAEAQSTIDEVVSALEARRAACLSKLNRPSTAPGVLRKLRRQSGLKALDVARHLGVARWAVTNWERGEDNPRPAVLERLAHLYNCSLEDITQGKDRTA